MAGVEGALEEEVQREAKGLHKDVNLKVGPEGAGMPSPAVGDFVLIILTITVSSWEFHGKMCSAGSPFGLQCGERNQDKRATWGLL